MRKILLVTTLSLLGTALPQSGQGAIIYRSNEGWSVEGDPGSKIEGSAADQMHKAEGFEAANDLKAALSAYRGVIKRYNLSALAPKAQRKIGVILERNGDYDSAYKAYEIYLDKYPRGEDFESVVESMYKIAKLFLDGQKKKLLGVPVSSSMTRAEEMFAGIVKKAPFNKWAPMAQFNAGQAMEKETKYPEAISAYQAVVARYPTDAIADDAQYQIGYVLLKEYREGSQDQAAAQKARESFEDFINRYPESEKVPQAHENLKTLQSGASRSQLDIAKFYDKTGSYKAAVIYYNDVLKNQPDTAEATYAKARIAALRSKVGEDALKSGPERAENGARAAARRKLQAKVDTVSRPDYAGPAVAPPPEPETAAPSNLPKLRATPQNVGPMPPALEPALPEALPQDPTLPKAPQE